MSCHDGLHGSTSSACRLAPLPRPPPRRLARRPRRPALPQTPPGAQHTTTHACTHPQTTPQDNSLLRRGKPCLHLVWGVGPALNAANYGFFLAPRLLAAGLPPAQHSAIMDM